MAKKGFTIIELVVSTTIVVMLTALFIANYHSNNKRTDLIMASQNLVADLHLAQSNTLGLVKYGGSGGVVPTEGWAINFDKTNNYYTLFANLSSPGTYDPETEGIVNYGARVMTLPPGIIISDLTILRTLPDLSTAEVSIDKANVTFLPPDPRTSIYDGDTGEQSGSLMIQLKEISNNSIKTVRVNFLGLAEVIN
ncbi:MAG: hypothetical protein WC249_04430 [Patescibacteria group bacterium]|jgi:type II secretory pathway pseudopilin PulG